MHALKQDLESLSLFVGTGRCNAHCTHCAGVPLRHYAPKQDGIIDEQLIRKTIEECYARGARYLSISSSGEPTLSPLAVTKVLKMLDGYRQGGTGFSPINLYSNGIKIGKDEQFAKSYLPLWQSKGLTTVYVTVHDIDEKRNAEAYGVPSYPSLEQIIMRIHGAGLLMRANIVLSKETFPSAEKFIKTAERLFGYGADKVSAWPVRNMRDEPDKERVPLERELEIMNAWASSSGLPVKVLLEESKAAYKEGKKLTLFPDGTLSSTWCNS